MSLAKRPLSHIEQIVLPIVESCGFQFWGLEFITGSSRPVLRIYIEGKDNKSGVSADDCQNVSRKLNAILAVEYAELDSYVLEVSSPGIDRLLFNAEQFATQVGSTIKIRLNGQHEIDGQHNFKGILLKVDPSNETLVMLVDGNNQLEFALQDVSRARVVPQWH